MKYLLPSFNTPLLSLLVGLLSTLSVTAQQVGWVTFDQLPRDNQLYARDDNNTAIVPISGRTTGTDWEYMSVITYRNNQKYSYHKAAFTFIPNTTRATFQLSPTIKAELADYSFQVYCCRKQDSVLMATRSDVVAGDFFVIQGQSNANALKPYNYSGKYARTFSSTPAQSPNGVSQADTNWIDAGWAVSPVGYWGRELQRQIIETYKIPVCVVNGAFPGTKIAEQLAGIYDHLLYRIQKSRISRIRAYFYYQGEDDILGFTENYPAQFDQLQKKWQKDMPMVDRFVIMQLNLLASANYTAGAIRELQRKSPMLYPKNDHFATVGLPEYDGIHYEVPGYQELAERLFRFLSPKLYKSTDTLQIRTPNIQKVFYGNAEKTSIVLEFDANQTMVWPADQVVTDLSGKSVTVSLKDFFYLDGKETSVAPVTSGQASGNQVVLTLRNPIAATKLNYLPSYNILTNLRAFPGPFLSNSRGLGAFTFHEFPIATALELSLKAQLNRSVVSLNWPAVTNVQRYRLERKTASSNTYELLAELKGDATSYEDLNTEPSQTYTYRLKAISAVSESPYASAEIQSPALSEAYLTANWRVMPNPATTNISLTFGATLKGTLTLSSLQGTKLAQREISEEKSTDLNVQTLKPGIYVLTLVTDTGLKVSKRLMKY
ncbi:sialate O-acetylesterase [Siphonobacter sp.]|uniref:sialate O-acetylesterase n=1 Tax=Siphonobacter sp. TaxID=1869184 RepID=UPI003B3AB984